MAIRTATAEDLVEEVFLFGRVLRNLLVAADETGLPPALIGVMHVLVTAGPCRQNELANNLCVSQSSLSRQIADLVDAGYVERHPDPGDGRASLVQLSESGAQLLKENKEERAGRLHDLLAGWSQDEADAALASLRLLKHTFSTPPARKSVAAHNSDHLGGLRP
ncbi:MarR family transcriptional regulator [Rhodococcus spelaei]|uniref:MarR family transcriptional regulator n=1 Tax=Rhodococcus spelaei TaxID=2546320 RepID=A0A541B1W0_9NOCA|nr:MarR family transcriptional regulator [Rhodococcus spelaei]TQF66298.1 MarR family transcriptional regulator [Rhodococcus spelaei]